MDVCLLKVSTKIDTSALLVNSDGKVAYLGPFPFIPSGGEETVLETWENNPNSLRFQEFDLKAFFKNDDDVTYSYGEKINSYTDRYNEGVGWEKIIK